VLFRSGHDCEHMTGETQDIRHFYGR
jgi:hypothetical protein